MKSCPFCAEEIQDAAIVCKHCGRDLVPPPPPMPVPPSVQVVHVPSPPRTNGMAVAGIVLGWIGIGGFLVVLFVTAIARSNLTY